MRLQNLAVCVVAYCVACSQSLAETEVSFYSGLQTALPSDVSIVGDTSIPTSSFEQSWEGQSLEWPIYAGFRLTRWVTSSFGYGLDYTHNKTAPLDGDKPAGFNALEFTDGLNTWTINAYYKWPIAWREVTPYVGAGAGLSVPGVEITYFGLETFNYQITGPAVTWIAGASMPVGDNYAVFAEYKGTYTQNDVDLIGGGTLSTDILTNAINIGFSYQF